jgi:cytochrome P450
VDVTLAELTDDPHPVLARLRATEPVAWVPALDGWLVTAYHLAVRVMRDPVTFTVDDPRFSTSQVVGRSMLSTDGDEHARHREPFARPFRRAEVRDRFERFVAVTTRELIDAVRPAGEAEVRSTVAGPLAVAVVAEALGLDVDAGTVLGWYSSIVDAVSAVTAGQPVPEAGRAAVESLRENVERTIARGDESIVGGAVGSLEPGAVVSNAAVLMFGGIDTTAGMITNAVRHVLLDPEVVSAGLDNVIEESLRVEPTAAVVDRYATRDIELGGAAIKRGDLVVVSIAGANRDPAVFEDPDRFDPHRENARLNLAFAQGPHFCLGAQLARAETRVVLRGLLELPGLRLGDHEHAPRGLVFRRPERLGIRWDV